MRTVPVIPRTAHHTLGIGEHVLLEIFVKVIYPTRKMLALCEHIFRQFLEYKSTQKFVVCHTGIPDSFNIL